MDITVSGQIIVFSWCLLCGVAIGIIFDIFRIIRRLFTTGTVAAMVEDVIYWILAALVFFLFSLGVSSGEMRYFQFVGAVVGAIIYFATVSRFLIKILLGTINIITVSVVFIAKAVSVPLRLIYKLIRKPLFLVFNIGTRGGRRLRRKLGFDLAIFSKFLKKI